MPKRTTTPPPPTSFAALTAPGCASGTSYGSYPGSGWIWQSQGGYCDGGFYSHWITGSDTSGDASPSTYTWWFKTGLTDATCSVGVYVPVGDTTVVGGHPGHYHVYTGSGTHVGDFTVDQVDNMGSWQHPGAFFASGTFRVVLDNEAQGSHQVAASALSVDCHV